MDSRKPNGYYALRWAVLQRDNYTCQYCGQYAPNVRLEVDHVIPCEDGGKDEMANLKTSCYACNRGKSGLRAKLRRTVGYVPTVTPSTPSRRSIVIQLLSNGPRRANEIATSLGMTRAYANVLLGRMVKTREIIKVRRGLYGMISQPIVR